jgi:hypothetical protein
MGTVAVVQERVGVEWVREQGVPIYYAILDAILDAMIDAIIARHRQDVVCPHRASRWRTGA